LQKLLQVDKNRRILEKSVAVIPCTHKGNDMRKTIQIIALVIALAGSVYAGDIQNPVAPPSNSQPTVTTIIMSLLLSVLP
jgi:hypothetical protein